MPVTIEVRNGQVITNLGQIKADFARPDPWMKLLVLDAERELKRQYRAERDPSDKPWASLALSTIAKRRNRSAASIRMLFDTGVLFNSIHSEASGSEGRVGTADRRAKWINYGTRFMPQREFMGLTGAALSRITQRMNERVHRRLRERGLR